MHGKKHKIIQNDEIQPDRKSIFLLIEYSV